MHAKEMIVLGLILSFVVLSDSTRAQDFTSKTPAPTAHQILKAWEDRSASQRSGEYYCKVTRSEPKGSQNHAPDPFGPPTSLAKDIVLNGKFKFSFSGVRLCFAEDTDVWNSQQNEIRRQHHVEAFDGAFHRQFIECGPVKLGGIWKTTKPEETLTNELILSSYFLSWSPSSALRDRVYVPEKLAVLNSTELIEGIACKTLAIRGSNEAWRGLLYVDPQRSYLPLKFVEKYEGRNRRILTIRYVNDSSTWRYAGCDDILLNETEQPTMSIKILVLKCSLNTNKNVDGSVFAPEFPIGAHIVDHTTDPVSYFVALANGERRSLHKDKYGDTSQADGAAAAPR